MTDIPVLIVGAGPTGLSAAVFLAHQGVPAMLVERRAGTSNEPKTRVLNPRTMELYRAVGIEEAIQAVHSPIMGHHVLAHARTVAGPELRRIPSGMLDGYQDLTPCEWKHIDQDQLEPVLAAGAAERGVELRFNTELVGLRDNPDSVTARLCDHANGREYDVAADYLIGADGAHSTVRSVMGIAHRGPGILARQLSVYFQADLREPLRGREIIVISVNNDEVRGALSALDVGRRWRFSFWLADGETADDYPEARCHHLVKAAIGVPDLPLVIERVSKASWEIRGQIAERMRVGRVFVAGDAAHVMPPVGAFGTTTGLQDVYNLAWKLALVHSGVAGERLLESYESERLPVCRWTTDEAIERFDATHGKPGGKATSTRMHQVSFGYTYQKGAFLAEPGTEPGELEDPAQPSGQPGSRAPHVFVECDGRTVSTVDLMGQGFVLFTGPEAEDWTRTAAEVALRFAVGVDCYQLGHNLQDPSGVFARRYGIGQAGAALVRPDGFIAWRTTSSAPPSSTLPDVFERLLQHRPQSQVVDDEDQKPVYTIESPPWSTLGTSVSGAPE